MKDSTKENLHWGVVFIGGFICGVGMALIVLSAIG